MNNEKIIELQSFLSGASIDDEDMLNMYNMMKKSKVLSIHTFKITPPAQKGKRWMTYYIDEEGNKKKICKTKEQDIYDMLYDIYFVKSAKVTIAELFDKFIERRKMQKLEPATIQRYHDYWNKYYINHKIVKKDISKITTNDIEEFYYSTIKEFEMTAKGYSNMSVILKDIFKHAKRDKLILYNVYDDIDMKLNCCKPQTKKKKTERVYLPAEKSKLFKVINEEIKDNSKTNGYAIFLQFKLALRIGELSALKWSDIDYVEKTIHIQRTEALGENRKRVVVEHVKLKSEFGDRYLPLSDYDIQILNLVKKFNEEHKYNSDYIFCNKKGRMTSRQLDNYLRTMCNNANIKEKSMHDIRRTVASEMYKNNVNIEVIRDFLGHSDIQTTFDYIYDCDSEETTKKIIINSLNDNNALDSVLVCTCA
ncbi:MAG: site-specific integrase [Lachnospiraceae bacterium]|nr:site-specific integrase [Lachnospiraceae bacterium]